MSIALPYISAFLSFCLRIFGWGLASGFVFLSAVEGKPRALSGFQKWWTHGEGFCCWCCKMIPSYEGLFHLPIYGKSGRLRLKVCVCGCEYYRKWAQMGFRFLQVCVCGVINADTICFMSNYLLICCIVDFWRHLFQRNYVLLI